MTTASISIPSGLIVSTESPSFLVTCGKLFSSENSREKLAAFSAKHFIDGLAMWDISSPQLQGLGRLSNTFWQAFSVLEFPRYSIETLSHFYSLLRREGENALDFFKSSSLACASFCLAQDFLAQAQIIQPIFSDVQSILLWRIFQGIGSFFGFVKHSGNFIDVWKETNTAELKTVDVNDDSAVLVRKASSYTWVCKVGNVLFALSADVLSVIIGVIVLLGATVGLAVNTMTIFHLNTAMIVASILRNFLEEKVKESGIALTRPNSDMVKTIYFQPSPKKS